MKNRILTIIILTVCLLTGFTACNNTTDVTTDYATLIVRSWRLTHINDIAIATDNSIVYTFNKDGSAFRAQSETINSGREWMECNHFDYTLDTHYLTLKGTDSQNNTWVIEFNISTINSNSLIFSIKSITKNGLAQSDDNIYTFTSNADKGYSSKLVGIWLGKETTANVYGTPNFYMQALADGTYQGYKYDESNSTWAVNTNLQGNYFIYGQLLAFNFIDTLNKPNAHCEQIIFDNNNKVRLKRTNDSGNITEYTFNRVSSLPQ